MPISQRIVKRSNATQEQKVLQHSTGEERLPDKTFCDTTACMKQLADLAKYAGEIFAELVLVSADVKVRYEALSARTAKLQLALPKLVVSKAALNIGNDEYQHHRQMLQTPQSQHLADHTSMPYAMQLRYSCGEVKPRVQFHSLDAYLKYLPLGPKAKTISQRYSNPEYFLSQWCAAQVVRMKQLEREKNQHKIDKRLRKKQRVTESAPEVRQPKRRSSVNWQDRYMVDGKAVHRKSATENGPKGTRLSLITSKVPAKRDEADAEADAEEPEREAADDVSAKNTTVGPGLPPRRNFATTLGVAPPTDSSAEAGTNNNSSTSSPLVRYSQIYPSKSTQQFPTDESSAVDEPSASPSQPNSTTDTSRTSPDGSTSGAKPAPPPAPKSVVSLTPPPPALPAPPAAAKVFKPQPDGLSLASNKPAPAVASPPPPPPATKMSSPPPPPPPSVLNSDDGNIGKQIASGKVPPPPTPEQLQHGATKQNTAVDTAPATSTPVADTVPETAAKAGDESDSDAEDEDSSEASPAVPMPVPVAMPAKVSYLDEMLSSTGEPAMSGLSFLLGGSRPAPPPPPPPPASSRKVSIDAAAAGEDGLTSPVRTLLKPRPPSSGSELSAGTTGSSNPRAARLSLNGRTASMDSVTSQLSAYPFQAGAAGGPAGGVTAMLSGLQIAGDEEAEIDHFAAVNSTHTSFTKEPASPLATTAGRMNLMDSIKQGGAGLRSTTPVAAEDRKSGGRMSLLDAIKQGTGTLRKVSPQEQAATLEEKKRSGSSLGGFGSSSVTAILERRKFLMAEESSDSDSDDGGWS